jgi:hypothetical protein
MKTDVILFHGDFDGIASAALIVNILKPAKGYAALPCEPFSVNKILRRFDSLINEGACFNELFMADLAPNNKCMGMTEKFAARCAEIFNKVTIYDHHNGWENIKLPDSIIKIIDASFKSCAALIYSGPGERNDFLNLITLDADIIDSGGYDGIDERSAAIYKALKANLKDDEVKIKSLEFMLSGYGDTGLYNILLQRAADYEIILARSLALMSSGLIELSPRICFVDIGKNECDITAIMMRCYEKYPVVIIEYQAGTVVFNVVATAAAGVDLVKILGLKGGAKYRVTIIKRDINELVKTLENGVFKGVSL